MFSRLLALVVLVITLAGFGSTYAVVITGTPLPLPIPPTGPTNDPTVNPEANACFAGGTLEGRCNPVDANGDGQFSNEEIQAGWIGGYYLIRYEAGMISAEEFPDQYNHLLQQRPLCYSGSWNDLQVIGPVNTLNNARYMESRDGTCSSDSGYSTTLVVANNVTEATSVCTSLGATSSAVSLSQAGYLTAAANIYICEAS